MSNQNKTAKCADVFLKLTTLAIILIVAISCSVVVKQVSQPWYFPTEILFALLLFLISFRLGKSHFSIDILEIAFYDLLFQIACFAISQTSYYAAVYLWIKPISFGFFMLYTSRIYWSVRSQNYATFVGWPTFGLIGLFSRSKAKNSVTKPSWRQAILAYLSIALCFPVGYVLAKSGVKFFELTLFCIPAAVYMLVKDDVFGYFEKISRDATASEQALADERAELHQLHARLDQTKADLAQKEVQITDLAGVESELASALESVVALSQQVKLCAQTQVALDQAKLRVDELLEGISDAKLAPDVEALVGAYEHIRRDMRPDFVNLAKSVAEMNPVAAPFALHLVPSGEDSNKLPEALRSAKYLPAITDKENAPDQSTAA